MSFLLGGALAGAVGGGLAVTVLAPLTAANNFLGSYFFGSGMILGERQMYQDDWIKIKKRLDAGESFLTVLEEVMKPNTQAIMQMARDTVIAVSEEWNQIVLDYLKTIPAAVWDAINNIGQDIGITETDVSRVKDFQADKTPTINLTKTIDEPTRKQVEQAEKINVTLTKTSEDLQAEGKIVPSGLNRKQVRHAITQIEITLKSIDQGINNFKRTKNPNALSRQRNENNKVYRLITIKNIGIWKNALTNLRSSGALTP